MNNQRKVTVIEAIADQVGLATATTPERIKVAAYARVSTEQDEQLSSYEAQVDYYTRYIQENPAWTFAGIFADEGITGTNTKKRDGFNTMVQKALDGEIDLILTKSISRFARNTLDTLQTVRNLKAAGVEVIFEKENLHTMDPKCEMMLTIMSSLAQEESRSISENVRWGKRKRMQDGVVELPYSRFLGYRKGADGRPEIVEKEAVIVRKIYNLFLQGNTIPNIANQLTDEGIPTPSGKAKWSSSTIKSILTNEKYKGEALLQKTYTVDFLTKEMRKNNGELAQYLVEYSHDPIIDSETFEKVQEKMVHYQKVSKKLRSGHPFACKLICGECGEFFGRKVWHNNTKRFDVWYCNHKYGYGKICQTPVLRTEEIQNSFLDALHNLGEKDADYTEESWLALVKSVTVYENRSMDYLFADGRKAKVYL